VLKLFFTGTCMLGFSSSCFLSYHAISFFSDFGAVCVCFCVCMWRGVCYVPGIQGKNGVATATSDSWVMCLILMYMLRQPPLVWWMYVLQTYVNESWTWLRCSTSSYVWKLLENCFFWVVECRVKWSLHLSNELLFGGALLQGNGV